MSGHGPTLTLGARSAAGFLWTVLAVLFVAQLAVLWFRYGLGREYVYGFVPLFSFELEQTVPALFSTCLFLLNAAFLLIIGRAGRQAGERCLVWLMLGCLFVFLAIDEFASIHEQLNAPVQKALSTSGVLYLAWVLPYGMATVLLGVFVLPTIRRLPGGIRGLCVLAAALYVAGAIGFEMLQAPYWMPGASGDLLYGLFVTAEETLEMAGLIVFAVALLRLLAHRYGGCTVVVGHTGHAAAIGDTRDRPGARRPARVLVTGSPRGVRETQA